MDLITILALTADATGLSIDLVKIAKALEEKRGDKQNQLIRARWRQGHKYLDEHRDLVTRFLYKYYANTASRSETIQGICYALSDKRSRPLPLVTEAKFLLSQDPSFSLGAFFGGVLPPTCDINEKDLLHHVSQWAALELRIWDAPLYSLQGVPSAAKMNFFLTRFLAYRATFGVLPDELALAVADTPIASIDAPRDLPVRAKILPSLESLMQFERRITAGGPAVLFAVKLTDKDVGIVIQRRSFNVSDEVGAFTVVPKAFHQPTVDPEIEVNPMKTVLRECYEELFGGEETGGHIDPDFYLKKCPAVQELADTSVALLQPTGLVWDLSRGNYHPLYCFLVRDPKWWKQHRSSIRLNWEVDPEIRPLVRLSDSAMVSRLLERENWAPESYVALVEGLRWLATTSEASGMLPGLKRLLPSINLQSVQSLTLQ